MCPTAAAITETLPRKHSAGTEAQKGKKGDRLYAAKAFLLGLHYER